MRCSPRSGCWTPSGTPTARSRSRASDRPSRPPEVLPDRRGAARRGRRAAAGRPADRPRHRRRPALVRPVDHGHGDRRTDVTNASNTLLPSVRVRSAAGSHRAGRGRGVRRTRVAPARPRAVRRATRPRGRRPGSAVPRRPDGWAAQDGALRPRRRVRRRARAHRDRRLDPIHRRSWSGYPAAQILITGVEDPDTRAHRPNESLHLPALRRAILRKRCCCPGCRARSVTNPTSALAHGMPWTRLPSMT